jgi:hypothetical protein
MRTAEAFPQPADFVDRRPFATPFPGGLPKGSRTWRDVRGITLHQTACELGTRDGRWDTLAAHFGVMRSGRIVYAHDVLEMIWHAQGWSHQCIGIEIDGLFAGDEHHDVWDNPATSIHEQASLLLPVQVEATKGLIRWLHSLVQTNGGELVTLGSHRQSYAGRQDDPGADIWRAIALPISAELGLTDGGKGFKLDTGRPNPETWNPAYVGVKY